MATSTKPFLFKVSACHRGVAEVGDEELQTKEQILPEIALRVLIPNWRMLSHYGHERRISGRSLGGASTAACCTSDGGRDGVPGLDISLRSLRLIGTRENMGKEMGQERKAW